MKAKSTLLSFIMDRFLTRKEKSDPEVPPSIMSGIPHIDDTCGATSSSTIVPPSVSQERKCESSDYESDECSDISKRRRLGKRKEAKFLSKWLENPEFAGWLQKKISPKKVEMAYCNICDVTVICQKNAIKRHSMSTRHCQNKKQFVRQKSIEEVFKVSPLKRNVRAAEVKLSAFLATNNLSLCLIDTLTPLLKDIFKDSEIAKNLALKRTKATAIITNVLGPNMSKCLLDNLRAPGTYYSIVMDETTDIGEIKQCAIVVIYFNVHDMIVKSSFLDIIETRSGSADDLTKVLLQCLQEKQLPLTQFVGFSSDTTNAMAGINHSVFTNLKKAVPGIACIKCSCHMVHLSGSHATRKLPASLEELLRNISSHFSRSYKRQSDFKEFQEFFNVEIHKILKLSSTRWLSMKQCVDRVLEQYEALKSYFRLIALEEKCITNDTIFKTLNNPFTSIYFEFLSYVLGLLNSFNVLFQSVKPILYKLKPEIISLLTTLSLNFLKPTYVKNLNNIFEVNTKSVQNHLELSKIYVGLQANDSLISLKENNVCCEKEIDTFFENCRNFYIVLVEDLLSRFNFEDPIFEIVRATDPKAIINFNIPTLSAVIKRFPVLKTHIDPQTLDSEWRRLCSENLGDSINEDTEVTEFWKYIFGLKNGAGELVYGSVYTVMRLLLVLPFSNASVERLFSTLKNIKTENRNRLNNSTLKELIRVHDSIPNVIQFQPGKEILDSNFWNITNAADK